MTLALVPTIRVRGAIQIFHIGLIQTLLNMPPINARPPLNFERPPFPSQVPRKFNLEVMTESMLMAQQK